jgi:hypothetical protein
LVLPWLAAACREFAEFDAKQSGAQTVLFGVNIADIADLDADLP